MTAKQKLKGMFAGRTDVISPLMAFIADNHAARLAKLWPAPHEGFFCLPTARRHAAAILCDIAETQHIPDARKRSMIEFDRDADIAREIVGDKAAGFMKLLGKLGETLWTREDYAGLLSLVGDPHASRVLRHMSEIRPDQFAPMLALRPILRETHILAHVGNKVAAQDLDRAFTLALRMRGERAAPRIAERWNSARTRERLFEMASEDLAPDVFRPPEPAPDLPPPFGRMTTRKMLHALALEFQNCLRDFTDDVARGRMAVYVWRDSTPAAVALIWDAAGWRLAEAEAPDNEELDEATLRRIVEPLAQNGVRTGAALGAITGRLDQHRRGDEHINPVGDSFVDQLALGDLWT
ncbi:MAG: hypothetical protein CME88_10330 [Hirschia sp.]|nr:hypothetical protein [Hirschia sp.]MBF18763.1 hypothetical protein [Hirschia sp.]